LSLSFPNFLMSWLHAFLSFVFRKGVTNDSFAQNYWVFGLCPSSGILETRKHNAELALVSGH
jgi:hypothetical protein